MKPDFWKQYKCVITGVKKPSVSDFIINEESLNDEAKEYDYSTVSKKGYFNIQLNVGDDVTFDNVQYIIVPSFIVSEILKLKSVPSIFKNKLVVTNNVNINDYYGKINKGYIRSEGVDVKQYIDYNLVVVKPNKITYKLAEGSSSMSVSEEVFTTEQH